MKVVEKDKESKIDLETASVSKLPEDQATETLEPLKKNLATNNYFENIKKVSRKSPKQCLRMPNTPQLRTGIQS